MKQPWIRSYIPIVLATLVTNCNAKPELVDEFIIMAYSGPPLAEVSLERYQEVAESGIEILVPGNGTFDYEQNLRALDLAQKTGIRIIPVDMRMLPFALKPGIDINTNELQKIAHDYKDHPAFAGYMVRDEPSSEIFPALKTTSDILREADPEHEPLINLFPNYGTIHQFGVADYGEYIRSFLEIVKPELLSYDSYPLRTDGITIYEEWFTNLEVVREETRKVNIPFLIFIQSEGIGEGLRVPNRAEILWQVNTALAYGAQGVGWFCYWTPAPDQGLPHADGAAPPIVEAHHNAMIDLNGKRTEVYDHVKEANFYLKNAGRSLLAWNNTEVARFENGELISGSSPVARPKGNEANLVIGTYEKNGKFRLVISNARCDQPASFSLTLAKPWTSATTVTTIGAKPTGEDYLHWALAPGGSVLIDLK